MYVTELSAGWYKIAWAFLKLSSKNNELNINKKIRLQLYKPQKLVENNLDHSNVFHWWQSKKLVKYPSSLHVTIKSYPQIKQAVNNLHLRIPENLEKNLERKNYEVGWNTPKENSSEKIKTASIDCQSYKLPNKCIAELDSYNEGALIMKFSNRGLYLAVAIVVDCVYTIVIYSVSFI